MSLITVHNFTDRTQRVRFDPKRSGAEALVDVFDDNHSRADASAYGHRWLRVGAADTALNRTPF